MAVCGHGEFQRVAMAGKRLQTVDQAAGEAVSAAHAVHDVGDVVVPAQQEVAVVVQTGRPAVVRGAPRFAQLDGDGLQLGIRGQNVAGEHRVLGAVELAGMHVHLGLDAERLLHVLLVGDGDGDIDELHHFPHHLDGGPAPPPEVLAVVETAENR